MFSPSPWQIVRWLSESNLDSFDLLSKGASEHPATACPKYSQDLQYSTRCGITLVSFIYLALQQNVYPCPSQHLGRKRTITNVKEANKHHFCGQLAIASQESSF